MLKYKLNYFDIDDGRGEVTRIALHAAGVDFDDNRITFPKFSEVRNKLRFHAVPTLEIGGE